MLKVLGEHWSTFYRYDTGEKTSLLPRYIAIFLISLVLAFANSGVIDDFSGLAVSIISIFAGFSFAIIFFIVEDTGKSKNGRVAGDDLEADLTDEKLDTLKKELFYNLSYFNLVSIVAVCVLLLHSITLSSLTLNLMGEKLTHLYQCWSIPIGNFLAFFLVLEAISTFYRIVARMTFYFSEKFE